MRQSDRAVASQQVSFQNMIGPGLGGACAFGVCLYLLKNLGALSLQSHLAEPCSHREGLSCWQVMNVGWSKGRPSSFPPSWKKK